MSTNQRKKNKKEKQKTKTNMESERESISFKNYNLFLQKTDQIKQIFSAKV